MALLTTEKLTAAKSRLAQAVSPTAIRARLAARASTTPGRLSLFMAGVGVIAVLAGLAAVIGSAQRSDLVDGVSNRSGPLTVQAQQLYRSLSDADATAAAAYLSGDKEPPELRQRYQNDIAAASAALVAASANRDQASGSDAVDRIATSLPVYTGLVETARAYTRLDYPVAAAYLREASGLMRDRILPAAEELYTAETVRLAADRDGASAFPWLSLLLILAALAGLGVAQVFLVRRTRRLINVGLAAATAAGLVALLWVMFSWIGVAANLSASNRDGSAQVAVIAQARIAVLQARADEALTLVARGSGAAFEEKFKQNDVKIADLLARAQQQATDPAVRDALAAAADSMTQWRAVHTELRTFDNTGQYDTALPLAIGSEPTSAASLFKRVDDSLAAAITSAGATFDARAGSADAALTGAGVGLALLTAVLLAGLVVGLQQRIAEYR